MSNWQEQLKQLAQKEGMKISSKPDKETEDKVNTEETKRQTDNISSDREAHAPYNFIPLNEKVVEWKPFLENDKYDEDRLTGYIDCGLKTLTPVYIRDTYTDEDIKKHNEAERKGGEEKYIVPDFFSPNGKPRIPGSSLRGMIRTLVEIVSWSKFGFFEDRGLYYRGLADKSNLREEYQENIVDRNDYYYPKIQAGFLKKDGHNYKIIPSKKDSNGCQIYRVPFDKYTKVVNGLGKSLNEFTFEEIYFQQKPPSLHTHQRVEYRKGKKVEVAYQLKYAKVTSIKDKADSSHPTRGFLVSSGLFGNKKHMHWLINEPGTDEIIIPECDIENYKKDEERKDKAKLLEKCREYSKYPEGIPCFYIEWIDRRGRRRVSFGHTGMFRLAYEKSIGEYVPDFLQDESKIDMVEAIFGKAAKKEKEKDSFAGRVFFEDAVLLNTEEDPRMREASPQILSTPKPTTFQHYLVQNTDNIKDLKHYNSDTVIRGNKLYWHKSGKDWEERKITFSNRDFNEMLHENSIKRDAFGNSLTPLQNQKVEIDLSKLSEDMYAIILNAIGKYETQHTKITPVKENTEFKFRIRFENLSEIELGALLFALNLPEGCAHKIGMAKPLGLGSVKITPTLVISDRKKRYESLFDDNDNWSLPEKNDKTIKYYTDEFGKFILGKINNEEKEGATLLWDTYRLKQLKTMLNVEKGRQLEQGNKIRYMQIQGPQNNEFRDRKVLPIPEKV